MADTSPPTLGPLAIGLITDIRPDGQDRRASARRYGELLEEVALAEELGFSSFSTSESHATVDGYLGAHLPVLGALATVTNRIRLMTNCLLLPLYQPRQVGEAAIVVDLLSEGRLDLGVALGGYRHEFDLFGVDWRRRGRVMERSVGLLREAFATGEMSDGPDNSPLPLTPLPVQEPIPILVGGISVPAVDRAVRLGDGHIAYDYENFEKELPRQFEEVLAPALQRHGRSTRDFRFLAGTSMLVTDDPDRDWEKVFLPAFTNQQEGYKEHAAGDMESLPEGTAGKVDRNKVLVDTPVRIAERLTAVRKKAPFEEFVFWHRLPGMSHERGLEQMQLIARELMPLVSGVRP